MSNLANTSSPDTGLPQSLVGVEGRAGGELDITLTGGVAYPRGAVIADNGSGKGVLMKAATDKVIGVLKQPVDATAADAGGIAWRYGNFLISELTFDPALTFATAQAALRAVGILGTDSYGVLPQTNNW